MINRLITGIALHGIDTSAPEEAALPLTVEGEEQGEDGEDLYSPENLHGLENTVCGLYPEPITIESIASTLEQAEQEARMLFEEQAKAGTLEVSLLIVVMHMQGAMQGIKAAERMIRFGQVYLNGEKQTDPQHLVSPGDQVQIGRAAR